MKTCKDCRSCGPDRPGGMIRCDHESWKHWDESMDRVFSPDFAPECICFEPKREKTDWEGFKKHWPVMNEQLDKPQSVQGKVI